MRDRFALLRCELALMRPRLSCPRLFILYDTHLDHYDNSRTEKPTVRLSRSRDLCADSATASQGSITLDSCTIGPLASRPGVSRVCCCDTLSLHLVLWRP